MTARTSGTRSRGASPTTGAGAGTNGAGATIDPVVSTAEGMGISAGTA